MQNRLRNAYADFLGAAFFAGAFFTAGRAAGLAGAAFGVAVDFTADFDFGVCGRVLPWLPA